MSNKSVLALLAAVTLFSAVALAQDAKSGSGLRDTCKSELASLCAAETGKEGGAGMRCLIQNQAKLGAACGTAVKTVQANREKLRTACKADADKLCAGTQDKGGQFVQCLRGKQSELSKPCAEAIAALPAPNAKQ